MPVAGGGSIELTASGNETGRSMVRSAPSRWKNGRAAGRGSGRVGRMVVADSAFSYADRRAESAAEVSLASLEDVVTLDRTVSEPVRARAERR